MALGLILALGSFWPGLGAEEDPEPISGKESATQASKDSAATAAKAQKNPATSKRQPARGVTDYDLIRADYQSSGALKFYDLTEDLLRAGQFERAFTRYLFLKTQIRGQALYAGLTPMVDQRLQFLRVQMRLGEEALPPVTRPPVRKYKKPRPVKKPPLASEPAPQETKSNLSTSAASASPPAVPPGAPNPAAVQGAPGGSEGGGNPSASSAAPETTSEKSQKDSTPEEEKEKPPAPPPSFWEKAKRKLMFWKKT